MREETMRKEPLDHFSLPELAGFSFSRQFQQLENISQIIAQFL